MGKLIWKNWSTQKDQIPQSVSILTSSNLMKNKKQPLDLQNLAIDPAQAAMEHSDWIARGLKKQRARTKINTKSLKDKGGMP